jgi:hypothetical protein
MRRTALAPDCDNGDPAGEIAGAAATERSRTALTYVQPPATAKPITEERIITVTSTQIQYSQTVL